MVSGKKLNQSTVVVNEFTVRKANGKGTRGATPGKYVTRYMARPDAVETVAPIRRGRLDEFIHRYMARADAVETVIDDVRTGGAGDPENTDDLDASTVGRYSRGTLRSRRAARSIARHLDHVDATSLVDMSAVTELRTNFRDIQGFGGVAFGDQGVSLSDEELREGSATIQSLFDSGHTVMKTVLSFDHDYLHDNGLIPESMGPVTARGGYRGRLDQMKLRRAIRDGLARMARSGRFTDLRYIGVIQVDTEHVHCHLAMVDAGTERGTKRSRWRSDGQQKGKLSDKEMTQLRRGVDYSLDVNHAVRHLSSAVGYERQNITGWIKRWAYDSLSLQSSAQFLLVCLPADRSLWRAGSNAKIMAKPNRIVREMVTERLGEPDSPLDAAMAQVSAYANERTVREGLSAAEHDGLVVNGYERLVDQCVNGVYQVLSAIPEVEKTVATPLLEIMSEDFTSMVSSVAGRTAVRAAQAGQSGGARPGSRDVSSDDLSDFDGFAMRLSGFSARLQSHRRRVDDYQERIDAFDAVAVSGGLGTGAEAMRAFYVSEREYHRKCVSKYRHFLKFVPPGVDWSEDWAPVADYGHRLSGLIALRGDRSLPKMKKEEAAEAAGRRIYGQAGGGLLVATGESGRVNRRILDDRIARMRSKYASMVDGVVNRWSQYAAHPVVVDVDDAGVPVLGKGQSLVDAGVPDSSGDGSGAESAGSVDTGETGEVTDIHTPGARIAVDTTPDHRFSDVKSLDMHDMRFDWVVDQPVDERVRRMHEQMTASRSQALADAVEWMVATDQGDDVEAETGDAATDIDRAWGVTREVTRTGRLHSLLGDMIRRRRHETEVETTDTVTTETTAVAAETTEATEVIPDGMSALDVFLAGGVGSAGGSDAGAGGDTVIPEGMSALDVFLAGGSTGGSVDSAGPVTPGEQDAPTVIPDGMSALDVFRSQQSGQSTAPAEPSPTAVPEGMTALDMFRAQQESGSSVTADTSVTVGTTGRTDDMKHTFRLDRVVSPAVREAVDSSVTGITDHVDDLFTPGSEGDTGPGLRTLGSGTGFPPRYRRLLRGRSGGVQGGRG